MTGLSVRRVTVRFGDTIAVNDVSLDLPAGETVALLGPSGCGKSTLLRVIAGLQVPAEGTVHWNGSDLASLPPEARGFGLMFQDHALFPHRNVAENVGFGLKMKGQDRSQQRARVAEMLELVDLGGFDDRAVDSLSGGEAQRVALARALAPSPQLLMLDEPLGSLDRALRDRLAIDIRSVLKELGQSAVHVTHDQDEAFTVSDTVVLLNEGAVVRHGTPQELWADPQSRFAAEFLGHPNVLDDASTLGGPPGPAVLRTEAITVASIGETATNDSALVGTVAAVSFRGDHFRVEVDIDTDTDTEEAMPQTLTAFSPTLVSDTGSHSNPAIVGQTVSLTIAPNGFAPLPN